MKGKQIDLELIQRQLTRGAERQARYMTRQTPPQQLQLALDRLWLHVRHQVWNGTRGYSGAGFLLQCAILGDMPQERLDWPQEKIE